MTINEAIWRDLSPFTIGFDNVFTQLDRVRQIPQTNYPPYNIRKGSTEDTFLIELAVAGFKEEDIALTLTENKLTVSAETKDKSTSEYLHKGLSSREFYKDFILNTDVVVQRADIINGVLQIQLTHMIPEELKPRTIEIGKDVSVKTFLAE